MADGDFETEYYHCYDLVHIKAYIGNSSNVVIPQKLRHRYIEDDKVCFTELCPVREIWPNAFANTTVKSIRFAKNSDVTAFKSSCFPPTLETLQIPDSLETIEKDTFKGIKNLCSIEVSQNENFKLDSNGALCDKDFNRIYCVPKNITRFKLNQKTKIISDYAFEYTKITKIDIPPNSLLEKVEKNAFNESSLTEFECPANLVSFCNNSFNTKSLKRFSFVENSYMKEIQMYDLPSSIEELILPPKLRALHKNWRSNLLNLNKIQFKKGNSFFAIENGIMYSHDYTKLYFIPKSKRSYRCRPEVRTIADHAAYNSDLSEIIFPENSQLITVEDHAISQTNITKIVFPKLIKECSDIGNQEVGIQSLSFAQGTKLSKLCKLSFGESIKKISIPPSVNTLAPVWCSNLDSLETIEVEKGNKYYISQNGNLYSNDYKKLCLAPRNIISFEFWADTNIIESYAFCGCRKLKSVTLPFDSKLNTIKDFAFLNCSSLEKFEAMSDITNFGNQIFKNCKGLKEASFLYNNTLDTNTSPFNMCDPKAVLVASNFTNVSGWGVGRIIIEKRRRPPKPKLAPSPKPPSPSSLTFSTPVVQQVPINSPEVPILTSTKDSEPDDSNSSSPNVDKQEQSFKARIDAIAKTMNVLPQSNPKPSPAVSVTTSNSSSPTVDRQEQSFKARIDAISKTMNVLPQSNPKPSPAVPVATSKGIISPPIREMPPENNKEVEAEKAAALRAEIMAKISDEMLEKDSIESQIEGIKKFICKLIENKNNVLNEVKEKEAKIAVIKKQIESREKDLNNKKIELESIKNDGNIYQTQVNDLVISILEKEKQLEEKANTKIVEVEKKANTKVVEVEETTFIDDAFEGETEIKTFYEPIDAKMGSQLEEISDIAENIDFKVVKVENINEKCFYVKKTLMNGKMKSAIELKKSFEIFSNVVHPSIERVVGFSHAMRKQGPALYLEFLPLNLEYAIESGALTSTLKTKIIVEICFGMQYLHKCNIIHRNLSTRNIMLTESYHARICDFSKSKLVDSSDQYTMGVGEKKYQSPEMFNNNGSYDHRTDVFSFGVVVLFMLYGYVPTKKRMEFILPETGDEMQFSQAMKDLALICIKTNYTERPSFNEILDWLKSIEYKLYPDVDSELIQVRCDQLARFQVEYPPIEFEY